jgi:tetratricopeptide (TPR) repeat protein
MTKYQKALEMDPQFYLAKYCLALCYERKSMFDEAIAILLHGNEPPTGTIAYIYAVSGRRREAQKMLSRFMEASKQQRFSPYLIAKVYVGLSEKVEAFRWLERAYEERDERMVMLKVDPELDSLRTDPRFEDLMRRVGLTP